MSKREILEHLKKELESGEAFHMCNILANINVNSYFLTTSGIEAKWLEIPGADTHYAYYIRGYASFQEFKRVARQHKIRIINELLAELPVEQTPQTSITFIQILKRLIPFYKHNNKTQKPPA